MITEEYFKKIEKESVFASGLSIDDETGVNVSRTGREIKWLAVKGVGNDWSIYCHFSDKSNEEILRSGVKIHSPYNIRKLVNCDDKVFSMYRH